MNIALDVKTIFAIYLIFSVINSVVASMVWRQNRHLRGVPEIALSYILGGVGLIIQAITPPSLFVFGIFFANLLVNISHGLGVNGFGIFLGRPNRIWLPISCAAYTILVWPPALYFAPDDRAIRIVAATMVSVITFTYFLILVGRSGSSGGWGRRLTGLLTIGHIAFAIVRAYWALQGLPPRIDTNAPLDVWSALESITFSTTLFLCFLAMVGSRLNDDLRARNRILSDEITHRLKLERQLSSALSTEVRLRSEQQQLIHIIGHEIRSPLAGIDRAAEMLMLGDTSILQRVEGIRDRVRSTVGMIDRLLESERNNHAPTRPEPLVLHEVIGIVVRGFEDSNDYRRIRVTMPDPPIRLVADHGMTMAVLRNLIENALKYSPADEMVTITARQEAGAASIIVSDRGIGIPEAERELIGQRFFRASNVGIIAGTGLGIFAVRRLLATQGGRLAMEAGPDGKGTAAIVTLPSLSRSHHPEWEPADG